MRFLPPFALFLGYFVAAAFPVSINGLTDWKYVEQIGDEDFLPMTTREVPKPKGKLTIPIKYNEKQEAPVAFVVEGRLDDDEEVTGSGTTPTEEPSTTTNLKPPAQQPIAVKNAEFQASQIKVNGVLQTYDPKMAEPNSKEFINTAKAFEDAIFKIYTDSGLVVESVKVSELLPGDSKRRKRDATGQPIKAIYSTTIVEYSSTIEEQIQADPTNVAKVVNDAVTKTVNSADKEAIFGTSDVVISSKVDQVEVLPVPTEPPATEEPTSTPGEGEPAPTEPPGLQDWEIALIAVGSVLGVALIGGVIGGSYYYNNKNKQNQSQVLIEEDPWQPPGNYEALANVDATTSLNSMPRPQLPPVQQPTAPLPRPSMAVINTLPQTLPPMKDFLPGPAMMRPPTPVENYFLEDDDDDPDLI